MSTIVWTKMKNTLQILPTLCFLQDQNLHSVIA